MSGGLISDGSKFPDIDIISAGSRLAAPYSRETITPQRIKKIPPISSNNGKVLVPIEGLFEQLLNTNPGMFIGDSHGDYNCAEFIISNMGVFKKNNVSVLFVEMVKSEDQAMLDRYYRKGDNEKEIISYFKKGWDKSPGMEVKYFEIIKAAKASGIRVIGIDMEHTGQTRLETSNPHWAGIINENAPAKNNKYIVFGGQGYSADYPANKGIDYRLGIPSIDLETGKPSISLGDGKDSDFIITLEKSPRQPDPLY